MSFLEYKHFMICHLIFLNQIKLFAWKKSSFASIHQVKRFAFFQSCRVFLNISVAFVNACFQMMNCLFFSFLFNSSMWKHDENPYLSFHGLEVIEIFYLSFLNQVKHFIKRQFLIEVFRSSSFLHDKIFCLRNLIQFELFI